MVSLQNNPLSLEAFKAHLEESLRISNFFTRDSDFRLVALATETLHKACRVSPKTAYKDRRIEFLRTWVKRPLDAPTEKLEKLQSELLAFRLGVKVSNLKASDGFKEFAEKNFLYNFLAFYNQELKVRDKYSPIEIMMDGHYVPWDEARKIAEAAPVGSGHWPWKYGKTGVQNKELTTWSSNDYQERAFIHKKHPHPGQYVFSIYVYATDKGPTCKNAHSWIRFYTPDGKVHEFAHYRLPQDWKFRSALMPRRAFLQCPDYSSWYPISRLGGVSRKKIHFVIKKIAFENGLDSVLKLQDNGKVLYNALGGNCTEFCVAIARECGIRIDARASIPKLLMPARVIHTTDKVMDYTPAIFLTLLYVPFALCTNLLIGVLLGGRTPGYGGRAHFDKWDDFLDSEKSLVSHPWYLINAVKPKIEVSRPAEEPLGVPDWAKIELELD